tara:strand:+ start:3152 stop:3361 length:210 start_codon:yes stop_codon:yes gene_type:complete
LPIYGYRLFIRPLLFPCCRFYPSCSAYALEALARFGVIKGIWLMCHRLLRCHPGQPGGIDLVPTKKEKG